MTGAMAEPVPEEVICHYCGKPAEQGRPWVFVPEGGETVRAHGDCAESRGKQPPAPDTGPVGG